MYINIFIVCCIVIFQRECFNMPISMEVLLIVKYLDCVFLLLFSIIPPLRSLLSTGSTPPIRRNLAEFYR